MNPFSTIYKDSYVHKEGDNRIMKLWYDRKSKDPMYFVQLGVRNGKKVTTKNIARIGKHSELLKLTDDPLAYAKEQVARYNEEAKKTTRLIWRYTLISLKKSDQQMRQLLRVH